MTQSASKHFIKFYIKRAKASPMQFAEYRADMVMGILETDGYTGIMVAFIRVIYCKTQTIGGWGKYEMLLLFATGQFVVYIF